MKLLQKISLNFFKKVFLIVVSLFVFYSVNLATGSGVNVLEIDVENLNFERILFVPGINTSAGELVRWKRDLGFNFPDKEKVFLDDTVYFYWQTEKAEKIIEKGVSILNDGKSTLILAHSYGGVLAKSIIQKAEKGNVIKLITMATPHQMESFGLDKAKENLEIPEDVPVETYSFGGYVDPIVFFNNSDLENSLHQDLWSSHNGFLFDKDVRRRVLEFALGFSHVE